MTTTIDHTIACTGCRIRRKKCDKGKPICSGCKALNVPPELCLYPEERTAYRGKNPREFLKVLKQQNKELLKQHLIHKHKFQDHFLKNFEFESYVKLPVKNRIEADFLMRDPNDDESVNWGHAGMLSCHALLKSEKLIDQINSKLIRLLNIEEEHYMKNRATYHFNVSHNDKLNNIRKKVTEMCIGYKEVDDSVLYDVLYAAVDFLPDYNTVRLLFGKYFQYNSQRALGIDEEKAIRDFHSFFKIGPYGELELILMPTDTIMVYYNKLAITLVIITYPLLYQYYTLPQGDKKVTPLNKRAKVDSSVLEKLNSHFNPLLLFAYIEVLVFTASCFQNPKYEKILCTPTILQAISQIRYFEFYFPHGKTDCECTQYNVGLTTKVQCAFFKAMELHKNIDETFPMLPDATSDNLKTLYFYMLMVDLREAFDSGLPAKFKYEELIKYDKYSRPHLVSAIIMCFRVVERFHKFETLFTLENPCDTIEMDFIYEMQVINQIEFPKLSELVHDFQNLDLKTLTPTELIMHSYRIQMVFCIYAMIMTLYAICVRKTQQFDPDNQHALQRFKLLSLKYAFLVNIACVDVLKGFQRIINSKDAELLTPIEPFIRFSTYVRISMRRSGILICSRMFEFSPFDDDSVLANVDNNNEWFTQLNVDEVELLKISDKYGPKLTVADLENTRIDRSDEELFNKFGCFLDHKFLTFTMFKNLNQIGESLINTKYDLQGIIQNNYVYSRAEKLTTFLLNMMYANGQLDIKPRHSVGPKSQKEVYKYTPNGNHDETKYKYFIPGLFIDASWGKQTYNDWFGGVACELNGCASNGE